METNVVKINALSEAEKETWWALFDIALQMPDGWAITGGSLMRLLLEERRHLGARATNDIDVVLDVRARRANVSEFYEALDRVGFSVDGHNASGQNHRWVRGRAQIDVLVPSGLSLRTLSWNYPGFGKLLPTRGAQFVLFDVEKVLVQVNERQGTVNRPTALGALYGKCSALLNNGDTDKSRHLADIALLSKVLSVTERRRIVGLSGKQKYRLKKGIQGSLSASSGAESVESLNRLLKILER